MCYDIWRPVITDRDVLKMFFIIVDYWNGLTILNHCNYDDSGHAVKRFGFAGDNDREPTIDGTSDDHGALQGLGSGD